MPAWIMAIMIVINSIGLLILFTTHRRVWGLKSDYGRSVYKDSILQNALRDKRDAWIIYAIILLINYLVVIALLEPVPTL